MTYEVDLRRVLMTIEYPIDPELKQAIDANFAQMRDDMERASVQLPRTITPAKVRGERVRGYWESVQEAVSK